LEQSKGETASRERNAAEQQEEVFALEWESSTFQHCPAHSSRTGTKSQGLSGSSPILNIIMAPNGAGGVFGRVMHSEKKGMMMLSSSEFT